MPGTVPTMSRGDQPWKEKPQIHHAVGGFESRRPKSRRLRPGESRAYPQANRCARGRVSARARTEGNNRPTVTTNESAWAPSTHVQREAPYLQPRESEAFARSVKHRDTS